MPKDQKFVSICFVPFRISFSLLISFLIFFSFGKVIFAQQFNFISFEATNEASVSAKEATISANQNDRLKQIAKENITQPEQIEQKEEIISLFNKRPAEKLSFNNLMAFLVQYSVKNGVPANTIVLILLLPFLATFIAFIRLIIGVPSMEMLVPIILSVTLIATGITTGVLLLTVIIISSIISKVLLKKLRIMQLPKMSISLFIVSILVFLFLTISAAFGIIAVRQLSIFPLLIYILLSDRIVALQLERSLNQTILITSITIGIGVVGYFFLSSEVIRNYFLLYPEVILLLLPINILIGRYFGLRITEYFRFSELTRYGHK